MKFNRKNESKLWNHNRYLGCIILFSIKLWENSKIYPKAVSYDCPFLGFGRTIGLVFVFWEFSLSGSPSFEPLFFPLLRSPTWITKSFVFSYSRSTLFVSVKFGSEDKYSFRAAPSSASEFEPSIFFMSFGVLWKKDFKTFFFGTFDVFCIPPAIRK